MLERVAAALGTRLEVDPKAARWPRAARRAWSRLVHCYTHATFPHHPDRSPFRTGPRKPPIPGQNLRPDRSHILRDNDRTHVRLPGQPGTPPCRGTPQETEVKGHAWSPRGDGTGASPSGPDHALIAGMSGHSVRPVFAFRDDVTGALVIGRLRQRHAIGSANRCRPRRQSRGLGRLRGSTRDGWWRRRRGGRRERWCGWKRWNPGGRRRYRGGGQRRVHRPVHDRAHVLRRRLRESSE